MLQADVLLTLVHASSLDENTKLDLDEAIQGKPDKDGKLVGGLFSDEVNALPDSHKELRRAPISRAVPGVPSIFVPGFTQADLDTAVAKAVAAATAGSITQADLDAAVARAVAAGAAHATTAPAAGTE